MRKTTLSSFGIAVLVVFLWSTAVFAQAGPLSKAAIGIDGASINSTPVTNVIKMGRSVEGVYTRLSIMMAVTWGTTALLDVTCQVSNDNTTWYDIQRCTSATPHDCGERSWQWAVADGTNFVLELESNMYPFVRCDFDDPGTGNGTITVEAMRGR